MGISRAFNTQQFLSSDMSVMNNFHFANVKLDTKD